MSNRDSLKTKIGALIAKAEGTDNANEASVFMAKAVEMMNKHQISIAELGEDDPMGTDENFTGTSGSPTWRNHLLHAVSRYYGGKCVKKHITHKSFIMEVNGSESVRVTIDLMFEFIVKQVRQAGRELAEQQGVKADPIIRFVANALVERINNLVYEARKLDEETGQSAEVKLALTKAGKELATVDELKAYVEGKYKNLGSGIQKRRGTSDGARAAANKVSLNRQVGGKAQVRLA